MCHQSIMRRLRVWYNEWFGTLVVISFYKQFVSNFTFYQKY